MKKGMMIMLGLMMSLVVLGSCGQIEEPVYNTSIIDDMTTSDEETTTNVEDLVSSSKSSSTPESKVESSSKAKAKSSSAPARTVEIVEDSSKATSTLPETYEVVETEKSVIVEDGSDFVGPTQEIEVVEETKEVGPSISEAPEEVQKEAKVEPKKETYIVFKPSTHYVHKSECYWVDDTCYKIENTNDIEAIKCTECNPDIEIVNEYKEPKPTAAVGVDDYSRQLLAEIVWHESGSDWISQYEKARVAAGVMNRVNDSRFPNSVYGVLTQANQFSGFYVNSCYPTQACYDAVDYYFSHQNEFGNENSWWGDGYQNYFYYQ